MEYTESYYSLRHGTDQLSAENILLNGFMLKGDVTSWCGKGVYFYDIKAKAWWVAKRKCKEIKHKKERRVNPAVILVDIVNIETIYCIKDISVISNIHVGGSE